MVTIGSANFFNNINNQIRVRTGNSTTMAQLMLVKRQLDFQVDLLQSALDLYTKAQMKMEQAQFLKTAPHLEASPEEVKLPPTISSDEEGKSYLEKVLGEPMSEETRLRFNDFLAMRKGLAEMRAQRDKLLPDPEKAVAPSEPPPATAAPPPVIPKPVAVPPALQPLKPGETPKPQPVLPNWQKDPSKWTIWLLDWLIASRVLPGAYNEINIYAKLANHHNAEMNALEKLEALLYRLENNKSPIPKGYTSFFKSPVQHNPEWWKTHPKLRAAIYSDLKPIIQIFSLLSKDVANYGKDGSVGSMFKKLQSDFLHQVGPSGVNLSSRIGKFISAFKNNNFREMAQFNPTIFKKFYKLFNQAPEITQKTSKGGTKVVKNPYWTRAWNNVLNSGPWRNVNNGFKGLSNTLTNLSTQDQTNLRTAFFALTTKVNAASDLLTTTGQMLSALAQNQRSSA